MPAFAHSHREVCRAYNDLLTTDHLNVRVKLDQVSEVDAWAMKEALKYSATILDMSVVVDNDPQSCNLELIYATDESDRLAWTIMPHSDGFNATISYNTSHPVKAGTLVAILIHEFGHLLGLCHTRDRRSIMYYRVDSSEAADGSRLTPRDIEEVGKLHALREVTGGVLARSAPPSRLAQHIEHGRNTLALR
jgi:hypothetical protein